MRNERASFTQSIITAAKELTGVVKNILEESDTNSISSELLENLLTEAERNAYMADETSKQHGISDEDSNRLEI